METNICKIKFRRGVEKDRKNIIPEEGEPIFTTDSHRLCIGDGETQGGVPITKTYFESDTYTPMKGDFKYEGDNLYLYTSDGKSVPVGGVASVSGIISNGLESDGSAIYVKQGDGITVNENGVSVDSNIVNAVACIGTALCLILALISLLFFKELKATALFSSSTLSSITGIPFTSKSKINSTLPYKYLTLLSSKNVTFLLLL